MNRAERKLAASKAIRALIMVETGRTPYNNIYKTGTRTLKIYRGKLNQKGFDFKALQDKITDLANMFYLDVKFNYTEQQHSFRTGPGFIVKI